MPEHLDACIDEEKSEDGEYPLEAYYHRRTCEDEDATKDQGSEDAPKEYLVLVFPLDTKERKEHEEYKEVVHRQGLFDKVARKELHAFC